MIFIPEILWDLLLGEFRRRRRRVEQVAYLDGMETEVLAVVTTLTFPKAILGKANFSVPSAAMSKAGEHLGPMARIAQVHTHPGEWVGHSFVDNELAYSHHDGALSIVLPEYGKCVKTIAEAGVHVCRGGTWRELTKLEADRILRVVPSFLDFR